MPASSPAPPAPAALVSATVRLLRPLVRLLLRNGVTFPVFAELVRPLFVDVAARDLLPNAAMRTDSRISLLTGVHRKEIRRLRELGEGQIVELPPAGLSVISEVIARWIGKAAFTDRRHRPLVLPRLHAVGAARSFEALVASVTTDVRPRAVLDAMLAQGLVLVDEKDRVHLEVAAFLPQRGRGEQLFYFGRNLHDHLAAASDNIAATGSPPFFDRSVHYDALTEAQAARLEAAGRELGQKLLLDLNRLALDMLENERAPSSSQPARRVNLGVYLYADDEPGREAS